MNLFFLDRELSKVAEYHHDIHLNKMILETAQMLSTAHHVLDGENVRNNLYKKTHVNHPMSIWVRDCWYNYFWTRELFDYLLLEYTFRKNKIHACSKMLKVLGPEPKELKITNGMTLPPLCMPDRYKISPIKTFDDVIESYRNYYKQAKQYDKNGKFIGNYTKRERPSWLD